MVWLNVNVTSHDKGFLGADFASFGDVLGAVRPHVSPDVVAKDPWERIVRCGKRLPAEVVRHEFGFELRPHDPGRVDWAFCVLPGTAFAKDLAPWARKGVLSSMHGFGRFLESENLADTPCMVFLEFDMAEGNAFQVGLFAGTSVDAPFPNGTSAMRSLSLVTGTDDSRLLSDWQKGASATREIVGPLRAVGTFPGRPGAPLRTWAKTVSGERASEVLGRLGWKRDVGAVRALEDDWPFESNVFLSLDFLSGSLSPVAGVEQVRLHGWKEMDPHVWAERLDWAASAGWCAQEQADAWASVTGSFAIDTDAGPASFNIGISHLKFVFGDGRPFMKVYVGGNITHVRNDD